MLGDRAAPGSAGRQGIYPHCTARPQRGRGGLQRSPCGDHVVDHQHGLTPCGQAAPQHDRWRACPRGGPQARLGRTLAAQQQAPGGPAASPGDAASQQLSLIEAAPPAARRCGGHPADHVGPCACLEHQAGHGVGQPAQASPRVAVLEAGEQLPRGALVAEQRPQPVDARRWRARTSRPERTDTTTTRGCARLAAHCALERQEHLLDARQEV